MASVDYYELCPRCRNERCLFDFNCRTLEESWFCEDCGYFCSFNWQRNEDNRLISKDGTDNFEYANLVGVVSSHRTPFAAYTLTSSRSSQSGTLQKLEDYLSFKKKQPQMINDPHIVSAYVSFYDNGEIFREVLKGEPDFEFYLSSFEK